MGTLIKDVISGLAAATAAVVAILGLQAWKRQLKGKTEYELAQRFLRSVYKVRETIAIVRNPLQVAGEIFQAMKEANIEGDPQKDPKINAQAQQAVYARRWQNVQAAFLELEAVSFEAEAIWGEAIMEILKPLHKCAGTLFANVQRYLSSLADPAKGFPNDDAANKVYDIIYGWPNNPDNNAFSNEITKAVKNIEDFLKPRLRM